ncbi:MAG TPA: iron ABC transporter permease [Chloroflexota bacterium]|nr:iron ABC transporter permease [Chloroflexota bacterium]
MAGVVTRVARAPLGATLKASVSWAQVGMLALIGLLGFYLVYPLILIIINSFNTARIGSPPIYGIQPWLEAWSSAGVMASLWNTLILTLCYQLISFPIGVIVSWILARTNIPWAKGLEFLFWLSFFIPSVSTTFGWMLLLDPRVGIINQLASYLGLPQGIFNIYSFWGIVWVHLMAHAISIKVMLLTPSFRNMDAALEEAGLMSGATHWTTFLKITLPVMIPALIVVFLLGLVRMFESFEIELLLGVPFGFYVFSTRVINLVRNEPPLIAQASALGSIALLLLLIAVPLQRWFTTRHEYAVVTGRMRPRLIDLGVWKWPVFAVVLILAVLLVIVPVLSVIASSFMTRFGLFNLPQPWTLINWERTITDTTFIRSLRNTLIIAVVSAIVGPLLFSMIAYIVVRARRVWGCSVLDAILWVPSIIPGALAGLGMLWMFLGIPVFQPLYGTITLLILVTLMGGVTISTQILKASLLQIGKELEEAARTSGANWPIAYFKVVLPIIAPTMAVVAALKFVFAAQNTSSIILLATSDTRPLSLLTLDYIREGLRESAAVTTVIITGLTTGVALLARILGLNISIRAS